MTISRLFCCTSSPAAIHPQQTHQKPVTGAPQRTLALLASYRNPSEPFSGDRGNETLNIPLCNALIDEVCSEVYRLARNHGVPLSDSQDPRNPAPSSCEDLADIIEKVAKKRLESFDSFLECYPLLRATYTQFISHPNFLSLYDQTNYLWGTFLPNHINKSHPLFSQAIPDDLTPDHEILARTARVFVINNDPTFFTSKRADFMNLLKTSPSLGQVFCTNNGLSKVPKQILSLTNLSSLSLSGNKIKNLPSLANYLNLKALDISNNPIISCQGLSIHLVWLRCAAVANAQALLPKIASCKNLRDLFLERSNIVDLGSLIDDLPLLRVLDASYNQIEKISELSSAMLSELSLSNNRLREPPSFKRLEVVSFDEDIRGGLPPNEATPITVLNLSHNPALDHLSKTMKLLPPTIKTIIIDEHIASDPILRYLEQSMTYPLVHRIRRGRPPLEVVIIQRSFFSLRDCQVHGSQ
jgi:hypothetical protein